MFGQRVTRQTNENQANGFSSLPPSGPAIPVTESPKSVPHARESASHCFGNLRTHSTMFAQETLTNHRERVSSLRLSKSLHLP